MRTYLTLLLTDGQHYYFMLCLKRCNYYIAHSLPRSEINISAVAAGEKWPHRDWTKSNSGEVNCRLHANALSRFTGPCKAEWKILFEAYSAKRGSLPYSANNTMNVFCRKWLEKYKFFPVQLRVQSSIGHSADATYLHQCYVFSANVGAIGEPVGEAGATNVLLSQRGSCGLQTCAGYRAGP